MAETVTISGQSYLKRDPLVVLLLSFITLGIYALYWYYKVNEEIQRYTGDMTISPVRSLMAVLFGWIIIVPPFIAVWNTANHVVAMERGVEIQQELSPAIAIVLLLVIAVALGLYVQEHLNRVWDRAAGLPIASPPPAPPPAG
jgi:uncharacterized membrane protein YidH (DUF202 family)